MQNKVLEGNPEQWWNGRRVTYEYQVFLVITVEGNITTILAGMDAFATLLLNMGLTVPSPP